MQPELQVTPCVSVHPAQITTFSNVSWHPYKPKRPERSLQNLKRNKHDGHLSDSAQKKLTRSTDYLLYLSRNRDVKLPYKGKHWKFRIAFVTLTLSAEQIHADQAIKNLFLNHFLTQAKQKWGMQRYVWRAEKQKNGNLHFHILTDTFIPWYELRDVWNNIQGKLGYIDRYRQKMKQWHNEGFKVRNELLHAWPEYKQRKAYQAGLKNDFQSPNSTDIHSVRFIKDIRAYVKKYMKKNEQELPVTGRIWGCSYDLASPTGARADIDSIIATELGRIRNRSSCHVIEGEYFTVFYITPDEALRCEAYTIYDLFRDYIRQFPDTS